MARSPFRQALQPYAAKSSSGRLARSPSRALLPSLSLEAQSPRVRLRHKRPTRAVQIAASAQVPAKLWEHSTPLLSAAKAPGALALPAAIMVARHSPHLPWLLLTVV
jgi:hypothetical protein